MNIKINTICFILLLFLLIGVGFAADSTNETLHKTIEQPENEICQKSLESPDTVKASTDSNDKLELKIDNNTEKLEAKAASPVLQSSKTQKSSTILQILTDGKFKVNIKAPDVKMHYKDGTKFTVSLKDDTTKAMKKAKVKITINGQTYTKTTDSKGKAYLNLNLKSGKYTVTTTFDETKTHHKKSIKSTVTVKSTIKCSDFSKYYKNKASYYSTFYDKKGKLLKETSVKFKLNSKTYTVKTNKKGVGKLAVNLKPGTYSVSSVNPKTSESVAKTITIKSILETHDLTMNEKDGSKFNVKVLNSNGKASPNKKVTIKVNGKTYTPKSNSAGIATQNVDLPSGIYTITTEYEGLTHTNKITVKASANPNKNVAESVHTPFSHITSLPSYTNITYPYVFHNSAYATKTGLDGIIRMPKNELFTIQISEKQAYQFSQAKIDGVDSIVIGYKNHLVPFDGSGVQSELRKENLKGNGIIISSDANYTHIEYRNTGEANTDMFGVYFDKGLENSETITYLQNNNIKAKVNFYTVNYDEFGLKYNLAKFHGKSYYDFNYKSYEDLIGDDVNHIRFANTGEAVNFSYFGKSIVGYESKEEINTRFIVNGKEELEKTESISYGLGKKYRKTLGFEVLQTYAIINEKITFDNLNSWISKSSSYLNKFGVMNVYGMFLAGLETAWLADEIADNYAKDLNVKWNRGHTLTVMGGINLDDTYIHILNADMGMDILGEQENCKVFRVMNSIYLPNIENYVLLPVGERYWDNVTNSIDTILESITSNQFSIAQIGELYYILSEDGKNSTIVINSTSGISNVLTVENNFAYKGAKIPTTQDCCGVGIMPKDLIKGIKNNWEKAKNSGGDFINNVLNKINPLTSLLYEGFKFGSTVAGLLFPSAVTGFAAVVGTILQVHTIGNKAKNMKNENEWHWPYKHVTFTRDGLVESKKFFNIPKSDGTYDYIEVEINSDGSLNRNNALYIGDGYSKKLTKSETYNYFTEEKWTSCNIPRKYQKNEVPLIFG